MRKPTLTRRKDNILPFEQSGEFFHRIGQSKLDRSNYTDALLYYRRALEKDPENVEYRLAMAETFTEMGCFEDSNRILLNLVQHDNEQTECFFGIGCNFVGLREYDKAFSSFQRYLALDPDGEFAPDAYDILDVLEEQNELDAPIFGCSADEVEEYYELAQRGKHELDCGDANKAIELLEQAVSRTPDMLFARNNLSLAYYCVHNVDKAISVAEEILSEYPDDVYANANLAIYYSDTKNEQGLARTLKFIRNCDTSDPDELSKLALALHELKYYDEAYERLKKLLRITPFDCLSLHQFGVCAYELERYQEALESYELILKIDPDNTVARYYRGLCRAALAGKAPHANLPYHFEVPHDEAIRRIRYLNECIKIDHEELVKLWQRDNELSSLVRWGLNMSDDIIKRAMINLTATFADKKAENILKDFIIDRRQNDMIKQEAFGLLKHMGVKEPYFAYIDGAFVEVKVNFFKDSGKATFKSYKEVISLLVNTMQADRADEYVLKAMQIWEEYIRHFDNRTLPKINQASTRAFAAALEYMARKSCGTSVIKNKLVRAYGTTLTRLNTALRRLQTITEQ